jgi:hypothetical protein
VNFSGVANKICIIDKVIGYLADENNPTKDMHGVWMALAIKIAKLA